jgi:hypothetical protein
LVTCKSAAGVGVFVGVFVGVLVGVFVGVLVGALVGVLVGVAVGATTVVFAEAELLFGSGSGVSLATLTVVLIVVPGGVPGSTIKVSEKLAVPPGARLEAAQLMVPVPPTGGVVQVHPGGVTIPWNVVLAGTAKVSTGLIAGSGPLLVTDIELVMF